MAPSGAGAAGSIPYAAGAAEPQCSAAPRGGGAAHATGEKARWAVSGGPERMAGLRAGGLMNAAFQRSNCASMLLESTR